MSAAVEISTLNFPLCGHSSSERMPLEACVFFYECKGCGARIKPLPGDCCVFCSYERYHVRRFKPGEIVALARDDGAVRMSELALSELFTTSVTRLVWALT